MEGPKRVKIKLRDISLVPQIQRSRRKQRPVTTNSKQTTLTRQLKATSAAVILLKLISIAISSNLIHSNFPLASCHNFKTPSSLAATTQPRIAADAQESIFAHQEPPEDGASPRLERLIGLMLNLSREPLPLAGAYERRSLTSSSSGEWTKKPSTASEQLRKLLARPRQVLSSFVPQILSKQMVLKRPPASGGVSTPPIQIGVGLSAGQVSRPTPVQLNKHVNQTTSSRDPLSHRHLLLPAESPGARELPFQNLRPPAAEFPQLVRPQPPPFVSMPPLRHPVEHVLPPDSKLLVQNQQVGTASSSEESDEEPSESASGDESGSLASEAERGLSRIDQLIKHEFENRLNLNEQAAEWQRQHQQQHRRDIVAGDESQPANESPLDTTLASPLNQAAGEPTTVQPVVESIAPEHGEPGPSGGDSAAAAAPPAVFLSWPPRIHQHHERQPAKEEQEENGEEWRPTDFPPSLLTVAPPLSPIGSTRKSRDSTRGGGGGGLPPTTAEIVLGRSDAMRLPPPPSQLPHEMTITTTAAANDALSAFVPSALETIAQLKLNQSNNNQQVMPSNVPTATTTTNVHKSQPSSNQPTHISPLNGRPEFGGEQQQQQQQQRQHNHLLLTGQAGGQQALDRPLFQSPHLVLHQNHRVPPSTNYLHMHLHHGHEPRLPGLANWQHHQPHTGGNQDHYQASSDLRETLRRLRETKAKIRQLQAELENVTPSGLFAAETNKTIAQYVDQLSTSQTSEQAKRSSQDAAAGRGGLEWFRSWSPPFNRTSGGGGSLRPAVRAQQSMNVPLGLYYSAGPLTTPARLVASALGRTVHHSIGSGPGSLAGVIGSPQPPVVPSVALRPAKIWSSTLAIPSQGDKNQQVSLPHREVQQQAKADLMLVRSSSAPILLGSTLRVATGANEPPPSLTTTTSAPFHAGHSSNETASAGSKSGPAGMQQQNQGLQRAPQGGSFSRPVEVSSSGLVNGSNQTLTSGAESDEPSGEEDDNDGDDERPSLASKDSDGDNNGQRPVVAATEGHQQRAPQIPTTLSAATDHHQRQDQSPPPPPRQQQYKAAHKNGDDKRGSSSFNQKLTSTPPPLAPAATESPIVIVNSPPVGGQRPTGGSGVFHVLAPPLVGLTTRKPGRGQPAGSSRVPIIPTVTSGAGESDRSLRLNLNSTMQAFDDFASEPPAPAPVPMRGDNFFARLMGDFSNLFRAASGKSEQSPIKIGPVESSSHSPPFQVARSLNSRAHFDYTGGAGGGGNQKQEQQVVVVAKLTTERLARNLIVIVSALSLVSLVAVLLFVRLQQARRTRRQNFSDPKQLAAAGPNGSQSSSGGGEGNPSSLEDDSLFFDAHHSQQQQPTVRQAHQQQHRCSGWRRLGPINFISSASKGYQQQQAQQDKIILDGTMRNVSLLAKHRQPEHHHRTKPKTTATAAAAANVSQVAGPLINRSCCHCVSCSESWLFRDAQWQQHQKRAHDPALCSSGFYHPAPRGKLPFGAASSVNNMLQRSASSRSQQFVKQQDQQQQQQVDLQATGDNQEGDRQQTAVGNQRAPIGGTRLRMMSAIDESAADRSSSTASDASEWQARMLLNGDCSDEFDASALNNQLTSACDCDHNHNQQHHYQQHHHHRRQHNLERCQDCTGHLLTPGQQQQQQQQPDSVQLESDGASFIVLNGHQHRVRAHQQLDEMMMSAATGGAVAPKDSPSTGRDQEIRKSVRNKNDENYCCRSRAGSSRCRAASNNKSSECHDKRSTSNCNGHRQTSAALADEIHNCSRCCDKVSISNHHHLAATAAAAASAAAKITTPNTIVAK